MHQDFRKLLDNAVGATEHVIAIIVDIRGFSSFCRDKESFDVANYIKTVYANIIDNFFPETSYLKPTGDGLLIILKCPTKGIQEFIVAQVKKCLTLVQEFSHIGKDNVLINFETPNKIGIGIARGSACKISSNSKVIDYSGRLLNLAARLMDFARPSGIVMHESVGFKLLPPELQQQFLPDRIYVRGIAEEKPLGIYYTKDYTIISPSAKNSPIEPKWKTQIFSQPFGTLSAGKPRKLRFDLEDQPLDSAQIIVEAFYKTPDEREIGAKYTLSDEDLSLDKIGEISTVKLERNAVLEEFTTDNLKAEEIIHFRVTYPVQ
jgi:class 3 adenylate cyclase